MTYCAYVYVWFGSVENFLCHMLSSQLVLNDMESTTRHELMVLFISVAYYISFVILGVAFSIVNYLV